MLVLSVLAAPALAQDPVFAGTEKEGSSIETPEAKLTAELGAALASGNSEFYVLTAGVNGSYRWNRSKLALIGGAIAGSSRVDADADGTLDDAERQAPMIENARRFYADGRYDFFLSARDSLYVLTGAYHDPFAGYDFRIHEQLGYSRHLVKTEPTTVIAELGVDYAQEDFVEGVDPNFQTVLAVRGLLALRHKFSEGVGFEDTFEIYENVLDPKDVRILNTASIVSALSNRFSLKLSHTLIFDNEPVEGYRPLDQAMKVTLVASIL